MRRYSHSSLKMFQRCPKKFEYNYIHRLSPIDTPLHLERGRELHELLASFYADDEAFHDIYLGATPENMEIFERYTDKWEEADEAWEIIATEEELEMIIGAHTLVFIPDMVVRINGELWVVDHKTTANIPDEWDPYNMSDFQHLLYLAGVEQVYGEKPAGFIFNYIRTKAPTQPTLIKDGSRISNVRALDTSYGKLLRFASETNQLEDPDVQEKLKILRLAPDRYFQRHFLPISESAVSQAVKDTHAVLSEMSNKENLRGPLTFPRHVLPKHAGTQSCGSCAYQAICHAELLGIEVDVSVLGYMERPERESK